jgi:hypothetical protein
MGSDSKLSDPIDVLLVDSVRQDFVQVWMFQLKPCWVGL